jgi:ubiquinone/menaquinone biosynthesis C-methylase UbiE
MSQVSAKAYKGLGMEGVVAKWYAATTKKSMEDFRALARRVAQEIRPNSAVLEVAPGPGYFTIELAKLGTFRVTGLDISKTFVDIARRNAREAGVNAAFEVGNASSMPFESSTFDFLLCRAAFKNFAEPVRALQEMYRVLKPGGRALIIDLRRDTPQKAVNQMVDEMHLGLGSAVLTKLTFRFMLLKRAYTRGEFEQFLSQTRFGKVDIQESLTGLEVWLEK